MPWGMFKSTLYGWYITFLLANIAVYSYFKGVFSSSVDETVDKIDIRQFRRKMLVKF